MANEVLTGAGQGAATGAAFGPYGALIGAGVGALSSYLGSRNSGTRQQMLYAQRARQISRPRKVMALAGKLLPYERSLIQTALGPQFQQSIASNIASRGLYNTGLGAALGNAAILAPGISAANNALNRALQMRQFQASSLLGAAQATPSYPDPMAQAILGGLSGGAQGYWMGSQVPQSQPSWSLMPLQGRWDQGTLPSGVT